MSSTLQGTDQPLSQLYDVALLDLDGVVYIGPAAVPAAPDTLRQARGNGMKLAFVTNNAARPPQAVAAHLSDLGIPAEPAQVITSAQAAARYLAERLESESEVLVLGTTGLYEALRERGLTPVAVASDSVRAVVQGYSPQMNWALLAEGAVAINHGVPWVATNIDPTVPSPRGPLPGNGSLVAALRLATRVEPVVTGKPDPTMHRETLIRTGARRPLVIGDRLDTDIEGANAVGCDSLLVLSGVTGPANLLGAAAALRPTYLAADVSGMLRPHPTTRTDGDVTRCGSWSVHTAPDGLRLSCSAGDEQAEKDDDGLDALRALCAAAWQSGDTDSGAGGLSGTGGSSGTGGLSGTGGSSGTALGSRGAGTVQPGDAAARAVLAELGL